MDDRHFAGGRDDVIDTAADKVVLIDEDATPSDMHDEEARR